MLQFVVAEDLVLDRVKLIDLEESNYEHQVVELQNALNVMNALLRLALQHFLRL